MVPSDTTVIPPDRPRAPARAPAGASGDDGHAGSGQPILRIVVVLLLTAVTLLLLSAILDDVHVDDFAAALGSSALIGLANALVWPLVIRFALPLTVLTLGLGVVVLNGAMVLLVAAIDPGL